MSRQRRTRTQGRKLSTREKQHKPTIIVALRDLGRSALPLLRKAAALARARDCRLELVHVIATPYSRSVQRHDDVRQAANEVVAGCTRELTELSGRPELRGLETDIAVVWDYPAADGLVRHVLKRKPELLLAESHRHARLARPFLTNTDWELIRKCPCPLWLSKSSAKRQGPVVAALDPLHAYAKPAALDTVILRHALLVAGGRPDRVFACHAYALPAPPRIDGAVEAYWTGMSGEEIDRYEAELRKHLDETTRAHGIPLRNKLLIRGSALSILPRVAKEHRASLVVMGAVSRSALARLVIGHTAERVIDGLDCDVLIVKPPDFKTDVVRRRAVLDLRSSGKSVRAARLGESAQRVWKAEPVVRA